MNLEQVIEELSKLDRKEILHGAGSVPRWVQGVGGRALLSMMPVPFQTVGAFLDRLNSVVLKRMSNDIAFTRDIHAGEGLYIDVVMESNGGNPIIMAETVTSATIAMWRNVPVKSLRVQTLFNSVLGDNELGVSVVDDYWYALNLQGKIEYLNMLVTPMAFKAKEKDGSELIWNREAWGLPEECKPCPCPPVATVVKDINGFE